MFKSKVDFNVFDKNNTKAKDLELTKAKNLAKAGVKKLASSPETTTSFHLAIDYFKDDKEKPLSSFVGFGENKKLDKHFEQVEMKSGKMDKSMTASPKEASMGTAYVKEINGKNTLCFEPDPKSKIPQGKWPKILKELKAWFAGIKAVAIFNGEVVGEEETTEEQGQTTDATAEETSTTDTTGEEETSTTDATGEEETAEEQGQEEVASDTTEDPNAERNRQNLAGQLQKIEQGIEQMDKAIGKASKTKLLGNVEKYEQALARLSQKAEAQNMEEEQGQIDTVTQKIEDLKVAIEERGGRLTEERRQKVKDNLATIRKELEKMMNGF